MLKDLAIETGVSAGLAFCTYVFIPHARFPNSVFKLDVAVLSFVCILGFLGLAGFQLKRLLNGGKTKHAVAFIAMLIAIIIIITTVMIWLSATPELM